MWAGRRDRGGPGFLVVTIVVVVLVVLPVVALVVVVVILVFGVVVVVVVFVVVLVSPHWVCIWRSTLTLYVIVRVSLALACNGPTNLFRSSKKAWCWHCHLNSRCSCCRFGARRGRWRCQPEPNNRCIIGHGGSHVGGLALKSLTWPSIFDRS